MKSIILLKLKLDPACYDELERIGRIVRTARNAAVEDWLLRRRGKPPSDKQAKPPTPRRGRDGVVRANETSTESTKLYHAVTAAAPSLDTQVAATIAASINAHLSAKVDWRRGATDDGKRPRRRDAILAYEDRPPFFSGMEIPVRSKTCRLVYGPCTHLDAQFERGRRIDLQILTDKLPPRHKRIMLDVSTGTRKQQDSRIVHKDGKWYWFLTVASESIEMDAGKMLSLWPVVPADDDARSDRPFVCRHGDERDWYIGEGRYYRAMMERLWMILKQIGWQYRQRNGTGHGRGKYDQATVWRRQQMRNVATEFRRKVIVSVLDQCERWSCGAIEYHEPTLPLRDKCWFAARGNLDWDWTRFIGDLKNAAARRGIAITVVRYKFRDAFPEDQKCAGKRRTEPCPA